MTTAGEISPAERVAVVTGGSGAIGSAIVRALRETGHRAVVLDYRAGDIEVDLSDDQAAAAYQGKRVATVTAQLLSGRSAMVS